MRIVLTESSEESAERVATEILRELSAKPDLVLGLATGSTPVGVYRILREAHARGEADFSRVHTFNLDEYLDLPGDHPRSYRRFMQEHLFGSLDIPPRQVHFPPTSGSGLRAQCADFERLIADTGGVDLQILGLGRNGHIGFNEPTSSLSSRTRAVTLCEHTLRDNARFFEPGEDQPILAVTMGIGTILEARRILLQASGDAKAAAIRAAVEGPLTSFVPASALQLHPDATFHVDPGAARELALTDEYRRRSASEGELGDRL